MDFASIGAHVFSESRASKQKRCTAEHAITILSMVSSSSTNGEGKTIILIP